MWAGRRRAGLRGALHDRLPSTPPPGGPGMDDGDARGSGLCAAPLRSRGRDAGLRACRGRRSGRAGRRRRARGGRTKGRPGTSAGLSAGLLRRRGHCPLLPADLPWSPIVEGKGSKRRRMPGASASSHAVTTRRHVRVPPRHDGGLR